jgi:hypothetical protein
MARASLAPNREHGNAEYVLIIKGLAEKVCDSYDRANIKRINYIETVSRTASEQLQVSVHAHNWSLIASLGEEEAVGVEHVDGADTSTTSLLGSV